MINISTVNLRKQIQGKFIKLQYDTITTCDLTNFKLKVYVFITLYWFLFFYLQQIYRHCADLDTSGLKDPRLHENTKISALYNLGRMLSEQERNREAVEVYKEALRRRPSYYAPQSIYNMLGNYIQHAWLWHTTWLVITCNMLVNYI